MFDDLIASQIEEREEINLKCEQEKQKEREKRYLKCEQEKEKERDLRSVLREKASSKNHSEDEDEEDSRASPILH